MGPTDSGSSTKVVRVSLLDLNLIGSEHGVCLPRVCRHGAFPVSSRRWRLDSLELRMEFVECVARVTNVSVERTSLRISLGDRDRSFLGWKVDLLGARPPLRKPHWHEHWGAAGPWQTPYE